MSDPLLREPVPVPVLELEGPPVMADGPGRWIIRLARPTPELPKLLPNRLALLDGYPGTFVVLDVAEDGQTAKVLEVQPWGGTP